MGKLNFIYNSITCNYILLSEANLRYQDNILPAFLDNREKFLLYDDSLGEVLLLDEKDMIKHYKNGNYRDYCDLGSIDSFEDFCLSSCTEVLKEFSFYSLEQIEEIFKEHYILKSFTL